MDGRDGMRAADADRQAVAERLRVAVEEGRLDLHEYDERLQRAYGARTYGELDAVLADLPGPRPVERSALVPHQGGTPAGTGPSVPVPAGDEGHTARWLAELWLPWLRVAAILTAIWLLASVGGRDVVFYWPLWVLGPWGAVLLFHTAGGLATGQPRREGERRVRRRAKRDERRRRQRERPDRRR